MEHRRFPGNSHWYHETQSRNCSAQTLAGDDTTTIDCFLLDLTWSVPTGLREVFLTARTLAAHLFPQRCTTSLTHTLSLYDRLSTALTVAQVAGVQRLCNHYAALLYPLSSSDSSRESNNRLTQMTQFARQLAMQPSLINGDAMAALDEVGLTEPDIVTLCQIVGFISYQSRVISGIQALKGLPVRWLPGVSAAPDAEFPLQNRVPCTLLAVAPGYANPEQQQAVQFAETAAPHKSQLWRLAHDAAALYGWAALHQQLGAMPSLATAVSARINGNATALADYQGELFETLHQEVEAALLQAQPYEKALIQTVVQLTRLPATFSAAHLQPLKEAGFTDEALAMLIQHIALANWDDRLQQAFTE